MLAYLVGNLNSNTSKRNTEKPVKTKLTYISYSTYYPNRKFFIVLAKEYDLPNLFKIKHVQNRNNPQLKVHSINLLKQKTNTHMRKFFKSPERHSITKSGGQSQPTAQITIFYLYNYSYIHIKKIWRLSPSPPDEISLCSMYILMEPLGVKGLKF